MTANASSSSGTALFELDLLAGSQLPALPTAFLSGRDRDLLAPVRFFAPGDFETAAAADPPRADRAELARALATANASYGHPAADRLAEKLADPATRVVATGQQPGLYGGPLLTLSKMVAAVKSAEAFERAGVPAVAVFWVATEDHDWAEIAQATFLTHDGVRRFDLGSDPSPLLPVGMRTFGPVLSEIESELGDLELPRQAYRPDARFGEAFSRFLVALLGERAPLMLDSMLPEVKRLEVPWLRRLVEERDRLEAAQAAADGEIEGRGYALQVKPQPGVSPLFLLRGQERRRIAWDGDDAYSLRGLEDSSRPLAQLLEILEDNPSVISPGVLARPAIQDALLGTTLQIMGPAELSYMSQVAPAYSLLGLDPPWTSLRPQALLLEDRHAAHLEELGVALGDLLATPLDRLVADRLGDDVVGPVQDRIDSLLESLQAPLVAIERGLAGPLRKTRSHVERGLEQLAGKVAAAVARRHEMWGRRLEQILTACRPDGKPQERLLSVAHFVARHGPLLAESMLDQLELDPRQLQVIRLSKAPAGSGAAP